MNGWTEWDFVETLCEDVHVQVHYPSQLFFEPLARDLCGIHHGSLLSGSVMVPLLKATLLSSSPCPSASRSCPLQQPLWVHDWQLLPETQSSSHISGNPDHISGGSVLMAIFSVTSRLFPVRTLMDACCLSSFTLPNQEDFVSLNYLFIWLCLILVSVCGI